MAQIIFKERDQKVSPIAASNGTPGAMVGISTLGPVNVRVPLTRIKEYEETFGEPSKDFFNYNTYFNAKGFLNQSNILYFTRVEADDKAVAGVTFGLSGANYNTQENTKLVEDFPLTYDDDILNGVSLTSAHSFFGKGPGDFYEGLQPSLVDFADYTALQALTTDFANAESASKHYLSVKSALTTGALMDSLLKDDIAPEWDNGALSDAERYAPNREIIFAYVSFETGPKDSTEAGYYLFSSSGTLLETSVISNDPEQNNFGPDLLSEGSQHIYYFIGSSEAVASGIPFESSGRITMSGADALSTTASQVEGGITKQIRAQYASGEDVDINLFIDNGLTVAGKQELVLAANNRGDSDVVSSLAVDTFFINSKKDQVKANIYTLIKNEKDTFNISDRRFAVYGNVGKVFDEFNKQNVWVTIAGHVAGQYAYTDSIGNPWNAPAGDIRGKIPGLLKLAINPQQAQQNVMLQDDINPIVSFSGQGPTIMGQNTTSASVGFRKVNISRLFSFIIPQLKVLARQVLFEVNNEDTRARYQAGADALFSEINGGDGLGSSSELPNGFRSVVDESNNTPAVIDANGFKAEHIILPAEAIENVEILLTRAGNVVAVSVA